MAQPLPSILRMYNMDNPSDYMRLRPIIRDLDYCDTDELHSMYSVDEEVWQTIRSIEQRLFPFYTASIRNQKLEGTLLMCECRTKAGEWKESKIDLDTCLA